MFDNRKAILWQPDHPALLPTLGNYRTIKILKQLRDQTGGKEGRGKEGEGQTTRKGQQKPRTGDRVTDIKYLARL